MTQATMLKTVKHAQTIAQRETNNNESKHTYNNYKSGTNSNGYAIWSFF